MSQTTPSPGRPRPPALLVPWVHLAPFVLLAACSPSQEPDRSAGAGAVAGVVRYLGADLDTRVEMDEPLCRGLHEAPVDSGRIVRGAEGGLANVLVFVEEPKDRQERLTRSSEPPDDPVVIRQEGCLIEPRVAGAVVGQTVRIVNRDPTLHSIQLRAEANGDVSRQLPFRGQSLEVRFEHPEMPIPLRCAVHPWARGWLGVLPHRYFAVTDGEGRFEIAGVPPGTYTLAFWHELLGTRRHEVRVSRGLTDRVELVME